MQSFSLNEDMILNILQNARPYGHHEDAQRLNLGFGFIYYGLARVLRPKHVAVIGSGFGFSVICLALGLKDNGEGQVSFVDPSYSLLRNGPFKTIGGTDNWNEPTRVQEHFESFGVGNLVTHFKMTSEVFFNQFEGLDLPDVDIAFIDGNHSYKNARNDFIGVLGHSQKNSYIFLHDSNIYIREMIRHAGVKRWMNVLKTRSDLFELIDFPFDSGVALVRVTRDDAWKHMA